MNKKLLYTAIARYKSKSAFRKNGKKRFWTYRQRPHRRKTSHDLRYTKQVRDYVEAGERCGKLFAELGKWLTEHNSTGQQRP